MPVVVILYEPVIEYMRSWEGDIGRGVLALCRRIRNYQRVFAPKKTGTLMRSIEIGALGHGLTGIQTHVGANPAGGHGPIGVAYWQSEGTRPHEIRPRPDNPHGHMVFFWAKAGRVVWRTLVFHPGNPATHWAMRGAQAGMAAWR